MPEPELSGALRPESDTGGGDTSQYTVIDDIGVTQQSQSEILPEISFDAYGSLFVRDPGFSGQRGAGLSHTQERQGLSTCTVPITGDIMFREEASSSHVSQQQPVVLQPTLSDRDGREAETVTPGPAVSGAGPDLMTHLMTQTQCHPLINRGAMSPSLLHGTSHSLRIRNGKLTSQA